MFVELRRMAKGFGTITATQAVFATAVSLVVLTASESLSEETVDETLKHVVMDISLIVRNDRGRIDKVYHADIRNGEFYSHIQMNNGGKTLVKPSPVSADIFRKMQAIFEFEVANFAFVPGTFDERVTLVFRHDGKFASFKIARPIAVDSVGKVNPLLGELWDELGLREKSKQPDKPE